MNIEIRHMRSGKGRQLALYEAAFDGWVIRECCIVRRDDGDLAALPPVIRNGIRAVDIPGKYWADFIGASFIAFRKWEAAGLRRFLGEGERESLGQAIG